MAAFSQKGGQQRALAPTISPLPSAQNNQHAKLHSLGCHILTPLAQQRNFYNFDSRFAQITFSDYHAMR